jgi:hypothetical protein
MVESDFASRSISGSFGTGLAKRFPRAYKGDREDAFGVLNSFSSFVRV